MKKNIFLSTLLLFSLSGIKADEQPDIKMYHHSEYASFPIETPEHWLLRFENNAVEVFTRQYAHCLSINDLLPMVNLENKITLAEIFQLTSHEELKQKENDILVNANARIDWLAFEELNSDEGSRIERLQNPTFELYQNGHIFLASFKLNDIQHFLIIKGLEQDKAKLKLQELIKEKLK